MTNYLETGVIIKKENGEENIYQIPYNINNIFITEKNIIDILNKFNVNIDKIYNLNYFIQAMTHKSYVKKSVFTDEILKDSRNELNNPPNLMELLPSSYERLEYLGDTVIKHNIAMYLFHRYPNEDEGFMTRLKIKLEDKKGLAYFCRELGLNKYFIISKQIEELGGRNMDKILEDVFEAFIGALFLSNGPDPSTLLIINLLETLIDYSEKLYKDNNYKDTLMRYYHKMKYDNPTYHIVYNYGPPHKRIYIVGVINPNLSKKEIEKYKKNNDYKQLCIGFGKFNSRKEAEKKAAKMALIIHGEMNEDQYTYDDLFYPNFKDMKGSDVSSETESDYGE
jgi:dsRNA-specific ribonuclease